ncbi:MAG TPA: DUF309 domain-containing protein [Thermoanaerobaculia bacterium]|nr:DUF309 domain-containing protein [Thermoanaerobaculia bacterium]
MAPGPAAAAQTCENGAMRGAALHPTLTPERRRALFLLGIKLFNRGAFFDAHEAWEEIWRSREPEPRDLFQGLIQTAAAMHHVLGGRLGAARRVLARGLARLAPFAPASHGLDIGALLLAGRRWESWLAESRGEAAPPPPVVRVVDAFAVR